MLANIFDDVLTNIAEADRDVLSGLAERNPKLKDYIADPAKVRRVDEVENWYATNYDFEHNCTKEEYARALRIEALGQLGKHDAARELAETFLARHPSSPLAVRVRALVANFRPHRTKP